jgi:hypothetical protein
MLILHRSPTKRPSFYHSVQGREYMLNRIKREEAVDFYSRMIDFDPMLEYKQEDEGVSKYSILP